MIDPNKLMRSVILALALLFAAPFAGAALPFVGAAQAQAAGITRISVSGNHAVDAETIESIILIKVGQPATPGAVSQSIDALYKTGLFSAVSVTPSGGTLLVHVTENPIVASVLFQGNQRFSDAELLTMVQASSRTAYSPDRMQSDVAAIKQAYLAAGYTSATVNAQTQTVDGGRKLVTFVINEGTRSGIAAINFTGNSAFNAGTLSSIIRTKQTGFLSWLTRDDNYTPEQLEIDKQLIRQYYANHGYPDTQVTSAVAEYNAAKNGYYITYTIVEGQRYAFGPSTIETSIPNLNTNALQDTVATNNGSAYSQQQLQNTAAAMGFDATQQGYPFASVRPRVDRDDVNHRLNITYLVDNGPRVYVERINITGNVKTRDFVIRRELDFSEGDPFNQTLIDRDKNTVMGLGFFKTVDITTEPGSAPDKVIVDVTVVETSTGDYGVTAGYSTTDGVLGEVSLTERNFLGRGQYVRAAIGASQVGKTFDFSFTEPRFIGLKVSTGFDLYDHISAQTATSYYGLQAIGGQVRAGLPITDALSANAFLGYEQDTYSTSYNFSTDPTFTPPYGAQSVQSQLVTDGTVRNKAFVGYNLNYVTLDDQKHPTTGIYAVFSQQYSGWDANVLKTELKARYYVPLADTGMVASVKGQAGIVNSFGGGVSALDDLQEGSSLVRGFEYGGYGPRLNPQGCITNTSAPAPYNTSAYCTDLSGDGGEYVGETAYAGLSAELQFPIPMVPESYGLDGAIWADSAYIDGGNLSSSVKTNIDPNSTNNPFRASVGASIIWDSPFGPLRGDFGYVVSKSIADRPQVFQITLQSVL
jgi:outer membrane protein insertion porin family